MDNNELYFKNLSVYDDFLPTNSNNRKVSSLIFITENEEYFTKEELTVIIVGGTRTIVNARSKGNGNRLFFFEGDTPVIHLL